MSDQSDLNSTAVEKTKKRRGLKWFCIDLWWVHLIVITVVVLCVTLPVVYVAYPRIAQRDINRSKLNITSMSITHPRANGFTLNLTTSLETHSAFHPMLKTWNGTVVLKGANESYLSLQIPQFKAKNGAITRINTVITLTDEQVDPFAEYVKTLVVNDTVNSYLVGEGPLKLGGLPTIGIDYNKTLSMGGFSGLKGITISNSSLLTGTQPDNATLAGRVTIPNPSGSTVELGNLTFGLSLPAEILNTTYPTPLGYATVNNTLLLPNQDNVFDLRSVANQSIVISAVGQNSSLLTTGLPITIVTRKVEYDGEEIPWLTSALAANPITQMLNISEILSSSTTRKLKERSSEDNMNGWLI